MVQRARRVAFTASVLAILAFAALPVRAADPSASPPDPSASGASGAAPDGVGCGGRLAGQRIYWMLSNRAGSAYDVAARLVEKPFVARLGATSVIENHPGASGLVGYKATQTAVAEGKTVVNLIGGAQTLIGSVQGRLPDPATGMYVLGQVAGSDYVWASGKDSPFETLDDVFATSRERPIVFAAFEPKGSSFNRMVGVAELMGLDATWVTGYRQAPQLSMAAIRQEVDLSVVGYGSQKSLFDSGDLRPLMTLKGTIHAPGFETVPAFAGPDGVAMTRARELGRDLDETAADMAGLLALSDLGRLIAMPHGSDESLIPCMRATLDAAFASPELKRDAEAIDLPLETQSAEDTLALIERARGSLAKFNRLAEAAAARLSQ